MSYWNMSSSPMPELMRQQDRSQPQQECHHVEPQHHGPGGDHARQFTICRAIKTGLERDYFSFGIRKLLGFYRQRLL